MNNSNYNNSGRQWMRGRTLDVRAGSISSNNNNNYNNSGRQWMRGWTLDVRADSISSNNSNYNNGGRQRMRGRTQDVRADSISSNNSNYNNNRNTSNNNSISSTCSSTDSNSNSSSSNCSNNTVGGGERGMLVFGASLAGREGQSYCVTLRVWGTFITPNVHMGRAEHGLGFDWWSILWERLSSLRRPDPRWVAEAPEWGVFVSFAVLDMWKDRRAPTLSHLILWLVGRRGTRRTRRGHRSLNWTKAQASRFRRRKAPRKRPPSQLFRRIRAAVVRVALQWVAIWALVCVGYELGRSAPRALGCALIRDAELLSVLLRKGLLQGRYRARSGRLWLRVLASRVWVFMQRLRRPAGTGDGWELSPQSISLGPGALAGGADGDINPEEAANLDAFLEVHGGKRVPNAANGECMYVALLGKKNALYLDVSKARTELADRARVTKVKTGLRRYFETEAQLSSFIDGLTNPEVWGNHLTLHLAANAWSTTIAVVQPGPNPVVTINPAASSKDLRTQKDRRVRVVSLLNNHYEEVQMDPKNALAMVQSAPFAELDPKGLTATPIPAMTKESPSPLGADAPRLFCPVPCCNGSSLHRPQPFSVPGLRTHIGAHLSSGDHIPHDTLNKLGLGQCEACGGIRSASKETCLQCAKLVKAIAKPTPRERTAVEKADDVDLPEWWEIAQIPIRTTDAIPTSIDRPAAVEFTQALEDVAAVGDEASWKRLCMFAKLVLPAKRGGKHLKTKVAVLRQKDVDEWREGEIAAMWRAAANRTGGTKKEKERKEPTWEEREKAMVREVRNGRMAAGMSRLHKGGLAERTEESTDILRRKHPHEEPQPATSLPEIASEPLKPIAALKAINSMAKGSAPGPFGLRGDHLKGWMVKHPDLNILPLMTQVLDLLRRGKAPSETAMFMAGATLVALKKGDQGDVRPISAGNTLRRVVSKIEVASVREKARGVLLPGRQVGVAVDGGLEAATMVVAAYAKRHQGSDKVIVQIDYENAFNSIFRKTFLEATRKYLPSISPWVEWCYNSHTGLVYGDEMIPSTRGAQQGDPAGPLLFSLGIKALTDEVRAVQGIDCSIWYLDDGTIMGNPEAVARALELVRTRSAELGLKVKLSKCEVIALGQQTPLDLDRAGLPVCSHTTDLAETCSACEGKVMSVKYGGFAFLGAPIGDDEYCEAYMEKKVEEFAVQLRLLQKVSDSQAGLTLLRQCEGFARMVFYMRAIGHACTHKYLSQYDKEVDAALAALFGDEDGGLPEEARRQAALPCRVGGMGVRRIRDHWTAAAMGARSGLHQLCTELDPSFTWDAEGWERTATLYNEQVAEGARIDPKLQPAVPLRQRDLSAGILEEQLRDLFVKGDAYDKARLNSLALPQAGSWLTAPPTWEHYIPPIAFKAAARLRLHLPIYAEGVSCRQCNQPMDTRGDHIFACRMGGHRILRHNSVRDYVYGAANEAGLSPILEPNHLILGNNKPADILLSTGVGESRGRAIDVTVWTPTSASMVQGAAVAKGYAATKAETAKRKKHGDACAAERLAFTPFALETTGGLGPAAASIWQQMLRFAADRKLGNRVEMSQRWNWGLGTTLQRQIGKAATDRGSLTGCLRGPLRERVDLDPTVDPEEGDLIRLPPDHLPNLEVTDDHQGDIRVSAEEEPETGNEKETAPETAAQDPTPHSELEANLVKWGLSRPQVPVPFRVGDCAFDAVCWSVRSWKVVTSSTLRSLAVERVKRDADLARNAMPDLATWVRWMSLAGNRDRRSWADQTALAGLARALQVVIVAVVSSDSKVHIHRPASKSNGAVAVLHTGAHEAGHFSPLCMTDNTFAYLRSLAPDTPLPEMQCHSTGALSRMEERPGRQGELLTCENCALITECSVPHWFCSSCERTWCEGCGSANAKCVLRAKPVQPVQPVQPTTSQTVGGSYYNSNPAPPQDAATEVKEEVMDEEDSADCADHDTTMDNNTATAAESFVWGPSEQSYNTTPTALTGDHHLGSAKTGGWTAKSHAERRTKLTTLGTSRRAQGNHTRRSGVVEDRSAETTARRPSPPISRGSDVEAKGLVPHSQKEGDRVPRNVEEWADCFFPRGGTRREGMTPLAPEVAYEALDAWWDQREELGRVGGRQTSQYGALRAVLVLMMEATFK